MNIENIEAFVYVSHFGSINKAAKALFLSQPSVTSRIQSLERELDTLLFDRVGKRLRMTKQARDFLPYAEQLIQSYKDGKRRLKEEQSSDQLVLGCTSLVSNYLFPSLVPAFKEKFPNVRIKLVTASSEVIVKKVLNREVDIGFVRSKSHPLIEFSPVMESPIRLFVKPNHRFTEAAAIDIEELAKEPIVFFECGSLDWSMIHNLFQNLMERPNIQYEADSMEVAKGLILNGSAIGFLPELCVRNEVSEGKLKVVEIPILSNLSLKAGIIHYKEAKPVYFDHLLKTACFEGGKVLTGIGV